MARYSSDNFNTLSGTNVTLAGSINAPVGAIDTVSGTNFYASTAVQTDTIVGDTTISGTTTALGNAVITGSVTADSKILSAVGTGSPTTWGQIAQAGSNGTDAGSKVWVSYGTDFSAAPFVNATPGETSEGFNVAVGSVGAGSFYIETDSAEQSFSWMAIGPA